MVSYPTNHQLKQQRFVFTQTGHQGTMETLTQATDRLRDAGFTYDLSAVPRAQLRCGCGEHMDAGEVTILQTVRFEGNSNPDDQDILLAVVTPCGHAGLLSSGYGANADVDTAEVLSQLRHDPRFPNNGQEQATIPPTFRMSHTSNEFTDQTVAPGLLRAHRLASNVWGRLCVRSGQVSFAFEATPNNPIVLLETNHVDIPPGVLHRIAPGPDSRFVIEFYQASEAAAE